MPPTSSARTDVPVRSQSALVGRVSQARRRAGLAIPRWLWPVLLLFVVTTATLGAPSVLGWMGLAFLGLGAAPAWSAWRSAAWPEATARVVDHEILRRRAGTSALGDAAHTTSSRFFVEALYVFEADGQEVMGLAGEAGIEADATVDEARARALSEWPIGRLLTVRYNPARPFMHTRVHGDVGAGLRRGALWLVLGVACLVATAVWTLG